MEVLTGILLAIGLVLAFFFGGLMLHASTCDTWKEDFSQEGIARNAKDFAVGIAAGVAAKTAISVVKKSLNDEE